MYFILASLLILLSVIEFIDKSTLYKRIALFIGAFAMVLFAGLRYQVGTDWDAYFLNYKLQQWDTEWGYKYLNLFFSKYLQAPFNLLLITINLVSLYLISKYIKNLSGSYIIALLIFYSDLFMYYNLSGMRQAIATSFTCFALIFAVKKQMKMFLFFIVVACLFHVTSVVFLAVYFLPRKSLSFKNLILISLSFVIVIFVFNNYIQAIDYLSKKSEFYIEIQENDDNLLFLFAIGLARRSVIIIVFLLLYDKLKHIPNLIYYFNIYLIGFIIYASLYLVSPDFGVRFSSYYTIVDMILIGNIIYFIKSKPVKAFLFILFVCLSLYKVSVYAGEKTYEYDTILNQ